VGENWRSPNNIQYIPRTELGYWQIIFTHITSISTVARERQAYQDDVDNYDTGNSMGYYVSENELACISSTSPKSSMLRGTFRPSYPGSNIISIVHMTAKIQVSDQQHTKNTRNQSRW
jgi:hypothetical protein